MGSYCRSQMPGLLTSRVRSGRHGTTLQVCVDMLGSLQQLQRAIPPLFMVENVAMQFNFRSEQVRIKDFVTVCGMLGAPVMLDAAQVGSYAHRCRNYWQNFVDPAELLALVSGFERPPGLLVSDIMDPGRYVSVVSRTDQLPSECEG